MVLRDRLPQLAILWACFTWLLPPSAFAQQRAGQRPIGGSGFVNVRPVDVALDGQGDLHGQVLDGAGHPIAGEVIVARRASDGRTFTTTSGGDGNFRLTGISAGVYQIVTSHTAMACRCWTAAAAPPAANEQLLIAGGQLVRGQRPIGELFFSPPVLLTTFIALGITTWVVVDNARDDEPAS